MYVKTISIEVPKLPGRHYLPGTSKMVMDFVLMVMDRMGAAGTGIADMETRGPAIDMEVKVLIGVNNYHSDLVKRVIGEARHAFDELYGVDIVDTITTTEETVHVLLSSEAITGPKNMDEITTVETDTISRAIITRGFKVFDSGTVYNTRRLDIILNFHLKDMPVAVFRTLMRAIVMAVNEPGLQLRKVLTKYINPDIRTVKIELISANNPDAEMFLPFIDPAIRLLGKDMEVMNGRDPFDRVTCSYGMWSADYKEYTPANIAVDISMGKAQKEDNKND